MAEAEIVAEAAAVNTMRRLGLSVSGEAAYLDLFDWVRIGGGWRRALDPGCKLHDRYRAAMLWLGDAAIMPAEEVDRELRRIYRRADAEVARREAEFRQTNG